MSGACQPSGSKSRRERVLWRLGRTLHGAVLGVPSGIGCLFSVTVFSSRFKMNPRPSWRFIGRRSGIGACGLSSMTLSFRMPLMPAIPTGISMTPVVLAAPPMPVDAGVGTSIQMGLNPYGRRLSSIDGTCESPTQPSSAAVSTIDSPGAQVRPMNWATPLTRSSSVMWAIIHTRTGSSPAV